MHNRTPKSWQAIRRTLPIDEQRVALYRRLMDAEARLDHVRERRRMSDTAFGDVLDAVEADPERNRSDVDVYLSALARYVGALGGHLDVLAVFPEETISLLREPGSS